MVSKHKFTIRAEKTGTNKDDIRVLVVGFLICIFLIIVNPFLFTMSYQNSREKDQTDNYCSGVFDLSNGCMEIPDSKEQGIE